ncbi:MAG: alpha/beta hydrolase [Candidatus Moranbacteria bacterium]|nr:alpha/beta hydrolase [Candidatus Moranbacteria bacterium]
MKQQVIIIHGGSSFDSYKKFLDDLKNQEVTIESFLPKKDWKIHLQSELGGEFQVLAPRMPNSNNARYEEWKIWFKRMFPFMESEPILIGHSQGGIFLVKYLSENEFPKKIKALFLVAPPHSETHEISDFVFKKSLEGVEKQCPIIHLYQSKDDPIVPFNEVERYKKDLPSVKAHIFEDRQHFNQEHFPEIVEEIKNL